MNRIFIIDDDRFLCESLRALLSPQGYEISSFGTAAEGMVAIAAESPDLLLLDISLPDDDGIHVCRRIRAKWLFPIIMLTSKTDLVDKIIGLEVGADDYLTKPFEARELIARIRACIRRNDEYRKVRLGSQAITFGPIKIDSEAHQVKVHDVPIVLTSLEYFAANHGRVLEREQLFETIWGYKEEFNSNSLDVFVYRLRTKLEKTAGIKLIHTVRGLGYRFEVEG
jgi:DNA-binding response OmpR family regulator